MLDPAVINKLLPCRETERTGSKNILFLFQIKNQLAARKGAIFSVQSWRARVCG